MVSGLVLGAITNLATVYAETSIRKPSIPEFTIENLSLPYDVPPTTITSIDPYTGKETITTQPGYHVENKTIQIKIKNQPFTPYELEIDGKSWTINLFYNIRLKGHFSPDWHYYRLYNGSNDGNLRQNYNSEYTLVPINDYLPTEGKVDIQIEALIGYEQGIVIVPGAPGTARIVTGESSGWSNTQNITIGANSDGEQEQSQVNPNETSAPNQQLGAQSAVTQPGINWAEISLFAALFSIIAVLIFALIYKRKVIRKTKP